MKPAIFLDRDGTLIESVHYLNRVDQVKLLPGAGEALSRLSKMGYFLVLVTNQAAIGKGLLTEEGLAEIHAELAHQLARCGALIDAWYHCPEVRTSPDIETIDHPDRKPGPGMLFRAANDHQINLGDSWMAGDTVSDTLAGRNAGCKKTVLVLSGLSDKKSGIHDSVDHVIPSIAELPELIGRM